MAKGKVSGKTHKRAQLNDWANRNNPNNKAFRANANNRSVQLNPNSRTHQQLHNASRKARSFEEWLPDCYDWRDFYD